MTNVVCEFNFSHTLEMNKEGTITQSSYWRNYIQMRRTLRYNRSSTADRIVIRLLGI